MKIQTVICLVLAVASAGCSSHEKSNLGSTFQPPPEDRLAEADIADCDYQSELSDIVGVVSPEGQGGWEGTDSYEIHNFALAAWRQADGDELQSSLTLLRPVPIDSDYFDDFAEGDILRMRVLLSVDETRAVVAEITDDQFDSPELALIASELEQPVEIQTERFGTLVLDRRTNLFQGKVVWDGHEVRISFDAGDNLDITEPLRTAQALLDAESDWQRKIEAFAVKERLPLANDWREKGVKTISKNEFLERMQLESISIQTEGEFEFWHSDGELFYGHFIQISGSLEKGLTHSDIPG